MQSGSGGADQGEMSPVARMMMNVAGHAITAYVQFRALTELLISRNLISREELEQLYAQTGEAELNRTIDEWFPADIAYHLKMAMQSEAASAASYAGTAVPSDVDEIARARSMQSAGQATGQAAEHAAGQTPEQ